MLKLCALVVVLLYPVTMLSARAIGDCAPAFAYVIVYVILLLLISVLNSSLYVPVILVGFTLIPVT